MERSRREQQGLARRWPFDAADLRKPDLIPAEVIERATGEKRGTQAYRFALMSFQQQIYGQFRELGRTGWRTRIEGDSLVVLSDAEAARYGRKRHRSYLKGQVINHRFQMGVDVKNLSDQEREEHARAIKDQATFIAAGFKALGRKPPALKPYTNQTPPMFPTPRSGAPA